MEKAGYITDSPFHFTGELLDRTFLCSPVPGPGSFLKEYSGNAAAADLIAGQRHEQSLYDKYKEYYGYVFYIGQKR